VFRKELGRAETRVRATRLVHRDAVETALAAAYAGDELGGAHAAVAAASVYTVETCAEVIADLFRYGGGRVLSLASPLQRYLRDVLAACQHIGVSEENYEPSAASASRSPLADR
jgi:alkylation response protein AidB-like acyl-CoA dehydrogenase